MMRVTAAFLTVAVVVYDLSHVCTVLNDVSPAGLFHLGVAVSNGHNYLKEYSFGRSGICEMVSPGTVGEHVLRDVVVVGLTSVPVRPFKVETKNIKRRNQQNQK